MTKRKTILLAACAALLCIYIVQLVVSDKNPVKTLKLTDEPDTVTIMNGGASVSIAKENGIWVTGNQKYPADENTVSAILSAVKEVKILDTVSHSDSESALERYELSKDKAITVTASKDGKELRTITVGKTSTTGSQTYIKMNSGNETYLASGNLRSSFVKTDDDLRSKKVYKIDAKTVTKALFKTADGTFSIEKADGSTDWKLSDGTVADAEKTSSWLESVAELDVSSWLEDSVQLPAKQEASVVVTAGGKDITLVIYKTGKDSDVKYLCTSTETPYKFEISSYTAGKYTKKAADFKK